MRTALTIIVVALLAHPTPAFSSEPKHWTVVASGANLLRPAYWEGAAAAEIGDDVVTILGGEGDNPAVLRYGPRIRASGDFGLRVTLQTSGSELETLSLVDAVPEEHWWAGMRRLEFGIEGSAAIVSLYDGTSAEPAARYVVEIDPPSGPVSLELRRVGRVFSVTVSGDDRVQVLDPGLFQTGEMLLATSVPGENALILYELTLTAPTTQLEAVQVSRCAPDRLLLAGSDRSNVNTGLWWLWSDETLLRQVESSVGLTSSIVAVSPDGRWATYYQRSALAPPDRFIVDAWVIDLVTDERVKLAEQSSPLGWVGDSSAVILANNPNLMAHVPDGALLPTDRAIATADAMKALTSPDGRLRAVVTTGIMGSATGVDILDLSSGENVMHATAGRGAITLAWSPDSTRVAFTSSSGGQLELRWRLQIADIVTRRVVPVEITGDMQIHSVAWAPALRGCP